MNESKRYFQEERMCVSNFVERSMRIMVNSKKQPANLKIDDYWWIPEVKAGIDKRIQKDCGVCSGKGRREWGTDHMSD